MCRIFYHSLFVIETVGRKGSNENYLNFELCHINVKEVTVRTIEDGKKCWWKRFFIKLIEYRAKFT